MIKRVRRCALASAIACGIMFSVPLVMAHTFPAADSPLHTENLDIPSRHSLNWDVDSDNNLYFVSTTNDTMYITIRRPTGPVMHRFSFGNLVSCSGGCGINPSFSTRITTISNKLYLLSEEVNQESGKKETVLRQIDPQKLPHGDSDGDKLTVIARYPAGSIDDVSHHAQLYPAGSNRLYSQASVHSVCSGS